MKKKQTKHFVPNKNSTGDGAPAGNCFGNGTYSREPLLALSFSGEVAETRREVTCGNCRKTRVFRKLK